MSIKFQLKHSSTANKVPLATDLANGELALNINSESPAAYIKDSAGNVIQLAGLTGSATAPATPTAGQVWVDSSAIPNVIKVWNGTTWVAQAGGTVSGTAAPTSPAAGQIWVDTNTTPNVVKIWDGTAWVTTAPTGVDAQAIANDAKYATKDQLTATSLDFTQAGTGAVTRTIDSKLKDVISVKDFGAVGNGVADDTAAIQAAVDASSAALGTVIHFPTGTYKTTASINLKKYITIEGSGREHTKIAASGNYPVLAHVGSSSSTVGRVTIRSIQIRGQASTNTKQFGIFCDWGGAWVIEDVSFRLCRIGYFQGTSRNNVIRNCDFISCHTAMWFGPIDQSGGGTPDNTVFMDTIDTVSTVDVGLRVEGLTGCKAVNCSFVNGNKGIYVGNYVQSTTPRAVLDGSVANVPAEADARQIRWMHFTNVFTDSVAQQGWIITRVTSGKATTEVKLVNCWAGNQDGTGIQISSCENIQIVGSTILNSKGYGLTVSSTTGVQISNLYNGDFNRSDTGFSGIKLSSCHNVVLGNITGEAINSTARNSLYMVELVSCADTLISGLVTVTNDGSRLVLINNSLRTTIANCLCNIAAPPVVESGTSNGTTLISVIGAQQPTLLGDLSTQVFTGSHGAPRVAISGGSAAQPALYMRGYPKTGLYLSSANALGLTTDGVRRVELSNSRILLDSTLLPDAADDAAARVAGVSVGQMYRSGSTIKVRIA